ncbi:16S rRNA (guanine(966)-N(2))-methyltransferase RsmD [Methylococcus sp. EFPC2]|uniref:16S rRNA (guanine(966)-N(2))-methyltransferase RsmD n=1 Tax=Methylococcus sp. EFPC2 TaxID=2812648 RepID=UPI00196813BF|nr:16S rRNA (guanine(966)-N(2))-methyltransferase RsmD [Methylococcus sp. EFPC2]QSA98780.1 16S rRNA (guanine(966)-N(2))-methyltransferase RsmD [Methylococcus sp. EFPC2]
MKNEVRIIGGSWRGRKLRFPAAPGLRPTPDRVRETVFNWLHQDLTGLTCLDLYAGSGALGFEAASRGAKSVVQVDSNADVCAALERNCALLDGHTIQVRRRDVAQFLGEAALAYDVVFLDPPFHQGLVLPCCLALEANGWLAADARIYIEAEAGLALEGLPRNWDGLRTKLAGAVGYHLYRRNTPEPDSILLKS